MKPPRTAKCPACGFVAVAVNGVKPEAGELRELKPKPKPVIEPEDKPTFYAELKFYGQTKGYNPHWADNQYRTKFGVWPNAYKHVPPRTPSAKTLSWIKSRMIAYAKGKAKREQTVAP
jgi:hypothetical protein